MAVCTSSIDAHDRKGAKMTVLMSHAARRNRDADPNAIGTDAPPLRREMPLVPAASIAGRALVTVIAIMTFLASLAAGTATLPSDAPPGWQSTGAPEATIPGRPLPRPRPPARPAQT